MDCERRDVKVKKSNKSWWRMLGRAWNWRRLWSTSGASTGMRMTRRAPDEVGHASLRVKYGVTVFTPLQHYLLQVTLSAALNSLTHSTSAVLKLITTMMISVNQPINQFIGSRAVTTAGCFKIAGLVFSVLKQPQMKCKK